MRYLDYINIVLPWLRDGLRRNLSERDLEKLQAAVSAGILAKVKPLHLQTLAQILGQVTPFAAAYSFQQVCALGFDETSDIRWNDLIFRYLVLPPMQGAARSGDNEFALVLEVTAYNHLFRRFEDTQYFCGLLRQWQPAFEAAGLRKGQNWRNTATLTDGVPLKVAFVTSAESMLAHNVMMINFARCLRAFCAEQIDCRVISLTGNDDNFRTAIQRAGVSVISIEGLSCVEPLDAARRHCVQNDITVAIWITLPIAMTFAFAMGLAPVQVFFAMKHHAIESDFIDGYITGGELGRFRRIGSRLWRNTIPSVEGLVSERGRDEARAIRARYSKYDTLLMTIAREEKTNNAPYLEAVAQILRKNPTAAYLWTGRRDNMEITTALRERGVGDRCFFVGWVDPLVYAHVMDIYLDSFPFPSGLTGMQAMAAGKPIVFCDSDDARRQSYGHAIKSGVAGDDESVRSSLLQIFTDREPMDLFLYAGNVAAYISAADQLIKNNDFRTKVGKAAERYIAKYQMNDQDSARGLARRLHEIVHEKLERRAQPIDG